MLRQAFRRLRSWVQRGRLDDDLAEEIQQHIELRRQSLIQQGMDPVRAEYEARRQFGNVTRQREQSRDQWGYPPIDSFLQDVRYAVRLLRRSPMFAIIAVASLGIGIGSATAVFSLVDAVLLRKLPVANPDELRILRWQSPRSARMPARSLTGNWTQNEDGQSSTSFSLPTFEALRRDSPPNISVIGFAGYMSFNIALDNVAETADGQAVSGNYFDALGLTPAAGRLIADSDDKPGAAPVAVISHALWRTRFATSPDIVGRTLTINGVPVPIVGVMPKSFSSTLQVGEAPAVTVSLALREVLERSPSYRSADSWWVLMMARLRHGTDPTAARSQMDGIFRQSVAAGNPELRPDDVPTLGLRSGARGQEEARDSMSEPLQIMALIVSIVLLVACAITANLVLARGQARVHEITVRVAIGASRARVVRQLFTEGVLLACLGTAVGIAVAGWIGNALVPALGGASTELHINLTPDWRSVAFTVGLTALCAALFTLAPALRATDIELAGGLRDHAPTTAGTRERRRLARGLIAIQVALSVLLIVAATLLVRSLINLKATSPGFDPANLLIFNLNPSRNGYTTEQARSLYSDVLDRLAALPSVRSTALLSNTLIGGGGSSTVAALPSDPPLEPGSVAMREFFNTHASFVLSVSHGFFQTLGVTLLSGRPLSASDDANAQPVVVINQRLARRLFGTTDVLGKRIKTEMRANATQFEIVGVSADVKYTSLRREAPPTMYFDYRQRPVSSPTLAIKTLGDPLAIAAAASAAVREVDPDLPVFGLRTQAAQIERSLRREAFVARMATVLGAITLLLCGIGLFGLLAYDVSRRTSEIGLRLALGAGRRTVSWMIVRQSLLLTGAGLAIGIPAAFAGARVLQGLLFGLTPADPWSFLAAAVMMIVVAALAAYLPARRASRVDPVIALRVE